MKRSRQQRALNEAEQDRFARRGLAAEVIAINEDCLYPGLPKHNICLATEVMEHLHDPLAVLARIEQAMESGGDPRW